jgi:hypothetical protein
LVTIMPAQSRAPGPADDALAAVAALPQIAAAADAARQAVDKLLASRVLRRQGADVSGEAGLRSARASAALEGASIPLQQLRAQGSADPVVQGALRCSVELGGLRETFARAPRQALARLHVLAAADLLPEERLGRPRSDLEESTTRAIMRRLGQLADTLTQPTRAPAVVVAAITHGELLTLQPFAEANGLVARAAARLVLISRGLDPKALTSPDVGHLELQAQYESAAEEYAHGGRDGLVSWVTHCCSALELGARDSLAICEALARG